MPSTKITRYGRIPRRWYGWRTQYPTDFPVELIITRRRSQTHPDDIAPPADQPEDNPERITP